MREDVLQDIRSRGYWRVNFRPVDIDALDSLSLERCQRAVQVAEVSLRGWNYPHFPRREGEDTGFERKGTFIEAWTDWMSHREFWRMYTSSQFLHYRAINEDWREREQWGGDVRVAASHGTDPVLGIINNLWLVAEVFEFLSRLHQKAGLYSQGVDVSLQLHQGFSLSEQGRVLWADDPGRFPLGYGRRSNAPVLEYRRRLSPGDTAQPKNQAIRATQYLFDKFGWSPSAELLQRDIETLYIL